MIYIYIYVYIYICIHIQKPIDHHDKSTFVDARTYLLSFHQMCSVSINHIQIQIEPGYRHIIFSSSYRCQYWLPHYHPTECLIGGLEHEIYFPIQFRISSPQLTNSYFSGGQIGHRQPSYKFMTPIHYSCQCNKPYCHTVVIGVMYTNLYLFFRGLGRLKPPTSIYIVSTLWLFNVAMEIQNGLKSMIQDLGWFIMEHPISDGR